VAVAAAIRRNLAISCSPGCAIIATLWQTSAGLRRRVSRLYEIMFIRDNATDIIYVEQDHNGMSVYYSGTGTPM